MYRQNHNFNMKGKGLGLNITLILVVVGISVAVWYFFFHKKSDQTVKKVDNSQEQTNAAYNIQSSGNSQYLSRTSDTAIGLVKDVPKAPDTFSIYFTNDDNTEFAIRSDKEPRKFINIDTSKNAIGLTDDIKKSNWTISDLEKPGTLKDIINNKFLSVNGNDLKMVDKCEASDKNCLWGKSDNGNTWYWVPKKQ